MPCQWFFRILPKFPGRLFPGLTISDSRHRNLRVVVGLPLTQSWAPWATPFQAEIAMMVLHPVFPPCNHFNIAPTFKGQFLNWLVHWGPAKYKSHRYISSSLEYPKPLGLPDLPEARLIRCTTRMALPTNRVSLGGYGLRLHPGNPVLPNHHSI